MEKEEYRKRLADEELKERLLTFGAVSIVGPKGCGKTSTAESQASSKVAFQDPNFRDSYLDMAANHPESFLSLDKPILFDEWQDAPNIWLLCRHETDKSRKKGLFLLTGSSSRKVDKPHTGTGRISTMRMNTFSSFELGESTGEISISSLFDDPDMSISSGGSATYSDLCYRLVRGGWPACFEVEGRERQFRIAKDYFRQIYQEDAQAIAEKEIRPDVMRELLLSLSRNAGTLVKKNVIYADVKANHSVSDETIDYYIKILKELYVIEELDAWAPHIRSKTAIRTGKKLIFLDPSLACAALGVSDEYFIRDADLFGHLFENLVMHDLIVYSEFRRGSLRHYSDRYGLEIDAVLQLEDGRYCLIEIKSGTNAIPQAEKNLIDLRDSLLLYNANNPEVPYRLPSFMMIISGTSSHGYRLPSGVIVAPLSALRD